MNAHAPTLRSTPFELEVRKDTRFDFSDVAAIHTADNLYTSHFFNALSLVTPITEGILIRAIRKAQPLLAGTELEADAKAFIGQEAVHTREHRAFNKQLEQLGYDSTAELEAINTKVAQLEDSFSLQEALALVVTGEHAIYSLAHALLNTPQAAYAQHQEVRRLFTWHALEEMEHQSVCDDIYRHLYGSGLKHKMLHYRIFIQASRLLANMISTLMAGLIRAERAPQPGEYSAFLKWLLINPALGSRTLKELLGYFSPVFSHWKRTNEDQQLILKNLSWVYDVATPTARN